MGYASETWGVTAPENFGSPFWSPVASERRKAVAPSKIWVLKIPVMKITRAVEKMKYPKWRFFSSQVFLNISQKNHVRPRMPMIPKLTAI